VNEEGRRQGLRRKYPLRRWLAATATNENRWFGVSRRVLGYLYQHGLILMGLWLRPALLSSRSILLGVPHNAQASCVASCRISLNSQDRASPPSFFFSHIHA
jgi:hypothetical protein